MAASVLNSGRQPLAIQDYFKLVQAIACKIKRRLPAHVDVEDLAQTGMIGLLEASSRFDAGRMLDFSSYANSRITGAILDELRKWDPCSRRDRRVSREIESARQNLRACGRCEPSHEEIAEAVGLGLAEYEQTLQRLESGKAPSMQNGDQSDGPCNELSRIPSRDQSPFESCSKKEDFARLRLSLNQLNSRQRRVLELHYFQEIGLKQIGAELGVGEARVSQIHKQAIEELRQIACRQLEPVPSPNRSALVQ